MMLLTNQHEWKVLPCEHK